MSPTRTGLSASAHYLLLLPSMSEKPHGSYLRDTQDVPCVPQSPIGFNASPMASPIPVSPSHHYLSRPCTPRSPNFAVPTPSLHRDYALAPRHVRLCSLVKPWLPLLAYLSTSLGFVVAIAFWRTELFEGLDELSSWLKNDRYGPAVMFSLIFITTFPPLPLYSTLIILSGYTFGTLHGAVISYLAALFGAVVVFLLSRHLLKDSISRWLTSVKSIKRVVCAIERRPQLLFLIRLAPYPYNVMNCLLAASPTLTFRTYFFCTALSLFKVAIHTSVGASVRSFAQYHAHASAQATGDDAEEKNPLGMYWTVAGVALCIGIIMYLAIVARRAVDEELGDDDAECGALPTHTPEERISFLSASPDEEDEDDVVPASALMTERARTPVLAADPTRLV